MEAAGRASPRWQPERSPHNFQGWTAAVETFGGLAQHGAQIMMSVQILLRCFVLAALFLTGCAGQRQSLAHGSNAYTVAFTVTRSADHAVIASVSLPIILGGDAKVKTPARAPGENQPVVLGALARLNGTRQPGVYELVTRVSVRETIRNKKGKLKINKRFIGALVPTRLGETQIVSAEGDPVQVEARLEHR